MVNNSRMEDASSGVYSRSKSVGECNNKQAERGLKAHMQAIFDNV